jgi:putative adhesin
MPTFETPQPISVTVELVVGDLRVVASERTDTVVDVRPSDRAKKSDVTAAEQTRVEYDDGRLLIKGPKGWRQNAFRGGGESIDVEIGLPAGSQVRGEAGIASFRSTGRLGECRFKTGVGEIRIDQAGPSELKTGIGDITIDRVVDRAELTTRSGAVRIAMIDGSAVIRNSNGDSWIGEVTGDIRVNAANGRISVDHAHAGVAAKTANGDVRLGEVARGAVLAETGKGRLDIAVREGVAAWLDLDTRFGNVDNGLAATERPGAAEETVEIRARSGFGDITVRRCVTAETASGPTG